MFVVHNSCYECWLKEGALESLFFIIFVLYKPIKFFIMQKYLNLKGTADTAFEGNQLVSINGIKTIRSTTAIHVDTLIEYEDGTTTTVKTAANVAFGTVVQLQAAVIAALQTSWTNPVYDVTVTKAIVSVINA